MIIWLLPSKKKGDPASHQELIYSIIVSDARFFLAVVEVTKILIKCRNNINNNITDDALS